MTSSDVAVKTPEIWSYGHRNPQGLAFDFLTQRLWSIEHGPRDDGQAHGRAERSVRTIEELVRVQTTDLELRTGA